MSRATRGLKSFFGVIGCPQSYLNIVYLLAALPLGAFYFVFLVTGLSLGFGLSIVLVGIPILSLVLGGAWVLCKFERIAAITLLLEHIPAGSSQPKPKGLWSRVKAYLKDRATWIGMLYLLLKFPLGIVTFAIVAPLIVVNLALLLSPILLKLADSDLTLWHSDPRVDTYLHSAIGVVMLFISLHLMNGIARVSGLIAKVLLRKR